MPQPPSIAYYVTSHGYGHLNRAAAVVAALPAQVRVIVRTAPDLFDAWRRSLDRPCTLVPGRFDSGAVHPPGDSSRVDPAATLAAYARVHAAALARLDDEVRFVRAQGCAAVVSDAASFPLRVAAAAGVPGVLVANFTWADIFRAYARARGGWTELLRQMEAEYAQATRVLRAQPAIERRGAAPVHDVGLVTRVGRRRRRELRRELGVPAGIRLAYVYVGRYGQDDMQWHRLAQLGGYHFVSYHRLPAAQPGWHVVSPGRWPARDLAASVDVLVAKAGYGTVADAMMHRVPLIYPPRSGFAEHRVLDRALRRWGGGIPVGPRTFQTLRLRRALQAACRRRPGAAPWPGDGARRCAREIMRLAREG